MPMPIDISVWATNLMFPTTQRMTNINTVLGLKACRTTERQNEKVFPFFGKSVTLEPWHKGEFGTRIISK